MQVDAPAASALARVARGAQATIGNHRHARLRRRLGAVHHGGELRHADAATTRVVQIEPGPMPTLIPSAPASISARVASPVATLPATTCTELLSFFTRSTARATSRLWPCAVSMTIRSHSASTSASVRSKPLSPTVVAEATRRRPRHPSSPRDR